MKIAITGHSAGIGLSFANQLGYLGYEVIGLSRRNGYNIRSVPKVAKQIMDCDMFINNAQAGYAQTELLCEVWNLWKGNQYRYIWCIGTQMTQNPGIPDIPGLEKREILEYKLQKLALEEAVRTLRSQSTWPHITMIRPGGVATQPEQTAEYPYADPDNWTKTVVDLIALASNRNLNLREITLGSGKDTIVL